MKSVGIHAAGENFAAGWDDRIVGSGQTGYGVKKNNHIPFVLDQALGFFNDHFRDLNMSSRRFVKSRGNDFPFDGTLHVRDLFRPLIDKKDYQVYFGVVGCNRIGDILQKHGFPRSGRGDYESALPFTDGGGKIHDPHG